MRFVSPKSLRGIARFAIAALPLSLQAQSPDPATFTIDKHASYTVTTDGWPYAFLSDSGAFYMMVGGMTRAPKAFRYDSTGHKGPPRTGIDLTRRSSDMAHWNMEEGKIFNVVFGPPDPGSEAGSEGDGEIIWGFVDPWKKDPAEPHTIGTLPNSDKAAPLGWNSSAVLSDGHFAFWVVPHLKKKTCSTIAVAAVNWRTGKVRVQEVALPVALDGLTAYRVTANEAGDALLALGGTDPKVKKDGWAEYVTLLLRLKADAAAEVARVAMPGHYAGCVACELENSGAARCAGFAVKEDKATPVIAEAHVPPGPISRIEWTTHALDEEHIRQLTDHARDPKEMAPDAKPPKPDPKERTLALSSALGKMRPIHFEVRDDGQALFVGEVQVRNEYLGDPAAAAGAGNVRDQILYAVLPPNGDPRIGVVRKYIMEEGPPGYGGVTNTAVMWHGERIYFFFNDWDKHEFEAGATPVDKFARINVATLEGAGIFDPVAHVEGPEGPIERTALQRSSQTDYMLNGCAMRLEPGVMLIALTKGRGIQWMKVEASDK